MIEDIIDGAVSFHGHLGPFLILGLKAGLFANKVLGKDCFNTKVTIETKPAPPYSCFIDGVQYTTGCTMGKRNIELSKGCSLVAIFQKEDKNLKLCLKSDILDRLKGMSTKEMFENTAIEFSEKSIQELFIVKITKVVRISS